MDVEINDEKINLEEIPALPPPDMPDLSPRKFIRLQRAYRIWCAVTLSAALGALLLLGADAVAHIRAEGNGYLQRLFFTRVLGAGDGDALIEMILSRTLYPRTQNDAPSTESPKDIPVLVPQTTAPILEQEPTDLAQRDIYIYDRSAVPAGQNPIIPLDLSLAELGPGYISNETAYTPDIAVLLEQENILPVYNHMSAAIYPPGDPLVLILHTHGTEAYSPDGAIAYADTTDYARSNDPGQNVLAVGEHMAKILRERGIPTLHCTILHDKDAYKDAYIRAAETIRAYLARYPSIQYVFDVHRDALIRGESDLVRPVTLIDGEVTAQVMILAGSDYKGANFPHWQTNLAFALQLREALNADYGNFVRPVYLRGAAFNEHFGPLSLLLEIGASGNSLPEAIRAGGLVAETLAQMIRGERT